MEFPIHLDQVAWDISESYMFLLTFVVPDCTAIAKLVSVYLGDGSYTISTSMVDEQESTHHQEAKHRPRPLFVTFALKYTLPLEMLLVEFRPRERALSSCHTISHPT